MRAPSTRPQNPRFGSGPTAKRPGWSLAAARRGAAGPLASSAGRKARLDEVIERSRQHARHAGRLAARHRARFRHRRLRDGDVEPARRARRRRPGLRELRRGLGHRLREAAAARRPARAPRRLRRAARPRGRRSRLATSVHLERHHVGRAHPRRRLDQRPAPGPGAVRCHLGRVRHGAALGQARCRHLVLAEGAGRRGAARNAGARPARRRAAAEPQAAPGRCPSCSG